MYSPERVLILSPHTDDGEFGCGGTISKLIAEGKTVYYIAFSIAEESVPDGMPKDILAQEVRRATQVLGIAQDHLFIRKYKVRKLNYSRQEILEELVELNRTIQPDLVFMPSLNDVHQDHQTVSQEGLRAFKKQSILAYELPWNNITFRTQSFVKLDRSHVDTKIKALEEYKSQEHRPYASGEFVNSLAKTRGIQISTEWAEAFEVVRWVL